jgi:hypothetical protein
MILFLKRIREKTGKKGNSKTNIAKELSQIDTSNTDIKKYESFIELLKDLDFDLTEEYE